MVNVTEALIYERPDSVSSVPEFFFEFNSSLLGGNLWGDLILISIFTVSYMSLNTYSSERAFAASSFLTMVATIFLMTATNPPIVGGFEFSVSALMVVLALIINKGGDSRV